MIRRLQSTCARVLWKAYERAPEPLAKFAGCARRAVAPLSELRVPLAWYAGRTPAGLSARVLTAGEGLATKYFLARTFLNEPVRTSGGSVLLTSLPRVLRQLRGEADLTIAEMDRIASDLLFESDYLRVPAWILATMPVSKEMKPLATRNRDTRNDWRVVRRSGLRIETSHRREDFEMFCSEMYLPFIRQRHGSQSILRSAGYLRRSFLKGGLFFVCDGEQRIAATLYTVSGAVMRMLCFGTMGGDYEPVRRGAMCALYVYSAELAQSQGCTMLDYGGSRPCARDGVLQFKRKWEMDFACKDDVRIDLLMRWSPQRPFIEEFLTHSPLFFRQGHELNLLASSPAIGPALLREQLWVNGLRRMYVMGARSNHPLPDGVVLSDPLHDTATPARPAETTPLPSLEHVRRHGMEKLREMAR